MKNVDFFKMAAKMPKIGQNYVPFSILIYKFFNTRVNPDVIL